MADLIGQSLGRYHILEQLGEGGMATVYKAYDTRLETDVAVKVIRTENLAPSALERSLKRFEREAKALARLTHPNIVKVTDFGEYKDKPYLVMPYLPGGTLKQWMKDKPLAWEDSIRLLPPIARALDFAHRQNMIHRDVKSSNILITADGEPMLADFGIAKILNLEETADLTGTGMGVGTPEYMAPEQWKGNTTPLSDQYALGVVLYEMVTGRKPYTAETPAAVAIMQATEPLPRPSQFTRDLPEKMEKLLLKALARNPEDRYGSMGEFAKALEGALSGQQAPQRKDTSSRPKVEEKSRAEPIEAAKTRDTQATIDQQWEESMPEPKFSFKEILLKGGELFGTLKRVNLKTLLLGLLMLLAILGLYFFTTRPSQQEYPINLYVEMGRITIYSDSDLKSPIRVISPNDTIYFLCRQDIAHGSYQVAKSQDDCSVNEPMGWVREKVVKRLFAGDFPVTEQVVVKAPTAKATEIIAPTPTIALVVAYPIQLFSNSARVTLYVDADLKTPHNKFLIPDRTVYYLCIENIDFSSSLIALSQENCITKNTLGWVKSASVIKLFHEDFPNQQP